MEEYPFNPQSNPSVKAPVDENGMRLAPVPMKKDGIHMLPKTCQPVEFKAEFSAAEPEAEAVATGSAVNTANDFQPKKRDINKRWKRGKRNKNFVVGIIMFLTTSAVLVPYILGACSVAMSESPFVYSYLQFDVFGSLVDAIKLTAAMHSGAEVNAAWIGLVPELILLVGIIALAFNFVKSVFSMCGATKPRKYLMASVIYLLSVFAVLIAALVGADEVGVAKIDFVKDVVLGYKTSELFSLIVFGIGNVILSALVTLINPEKSGYTKS